MKDENNKRQKLIDSLIAIGLNVREISKRPLLFKVNKNIVNIRTNYKYKNKPTGEEFWYDVNKTALQKADYVLYQMINEKYFLFISSDFLLENWDNFYTSKSSDNNRNFMIEWDELSIVAHERICVDKCYCNIDEKEGLIFDLLNHL